MMKTDCEIGWKSYYFLGHVDALVCHDLVLKVAGVCLWVLFQAEIFFVAVVVAAPACGPVEGVPLVLPLGGPDREDP